MKSTGRIVLTLLALLLALLLPITALSEIKNCNGKWTNGPCDEATSVIIPESKDDSNSSPDRNDRRSLYTDLDLRNFRAKRELGVEVSLEDARVACLSDRATLKECRKVTAAQNERLDTLIAQARIHAPATQLPTPQPVVQDQNQVVIINNNNDDDDWRRRWRRKKKDRYSDTYDLSIKHEVDEGSLAHQAKKRREAEEKADIEPPVQRGGKIN